jgi:hypothetical protein
MTTESVFRTGLDIALEQLVKDAEEGLQKGLELGREEGLELGLQKGLEKSLEANIEMISELLTDRFGSKLVDYHVKERLRNANFEELNRWGRRIIKAKTLEELFRD